MYVHKIPRLLSRLYPERVWYVPSAGDTIYLTFDDGPIPGLTDHILDVLASFEVSATFFCVGENLVKNREIAVRMAEEGHRPANHTFNHLNGRRSSFRRYIDNVTQCEQQLEGLGQRQNLFRPPYGKVTGIQARHIASSYKIVMWDVLSGDYNRRIRPEECLKNTVRATEGGSIVLFHDNLKAQRNVQYVLPRFIEHFLCKDFEFDTL